MINSKVFAFLFLIKLTVALYESGDDVVQLTSASFDRLVVQSDNVWIIEFYAPWCGHCKSLAPEYKKAARALKGVVKVGAVDCDEHKDIAGKYGVTGFPTLKIFNGKDNTAYQGERNGKAIAEAGLAAAKKKVKEQLDGKSSGSGSKSGGSGSGKDDVIELTDSNFEKLVLNSDDVWLVEFFAPWCGHCKNLAPEWSKAATELKGKVKLGAVDATVHQSLAGQFDVKGYPTIKFFPGGKKHRGSAEEFTGGRTASDIVQWANEKYLTSIPAPEVYELTSDEVAKKACENQPICVVAILPNIYDCQAQCRNDYIKILKEMADKYKAKQWGWLWAEGGSQPGVEDALEMGGFGYPAMAAVSIKKLKFSALRGSFSESGINEFLRDLSYGKGNTAPVRGAQMPNIETVKAWDGKDAPPIVEEDIDLSDVDLDEKDEL